jgi:hypothetical protein
MVGISELEPGAHEDDDADDDDVEEWGLNMLGIGEM